MASRLRLSVALLGAFILLSTLTPSARADASGATATLTDCLPDDSEVANSTAALVLLSQLSTALCRTGNMPPLPADGAELFAKLQKDYNFTILYSCSKAKNATNSSSDTAASPTGAPTDAPTTIAGNATSGSYYFRFAWSWNNPCRGNTNEQFTSVATVDICSAAEEADATVSTSSIGAEALAGEGTRRRTSRKLLAGIDSMASTAEPAGVARPAAGVNADAAELLPAVVQCGQPYDVIMASVQVPL